MSRPRVALLALATVAVVLLAVIGLVQLRPGREEPDPVWSIGILTGEGPLDLRDPEGTANPVLTRDDVTDRMAGFVADPFLIRDQETWYLFHEVWDHDEGQGDIGVATSADGRSWSYEGIVLDEPHHLSYPQVLAWEGSFWMVPESRKSGAIRLYRADALPGPWTPVATLLEGGPMTDPTVFRHEGRWWMLAADESSDALHLFLADELEGPWREHPASPVLEGDPRGARPAGRVVEHEGRLLRFAQDRTPEYGSRVWAFEIFELTPDAYRERLLGDGPVLEGSGRGWNRDRMHHLDAHRRGDGTWIAAVDGRGPP